MRATWRGLPARRYDVRWEPGLRVPADDGSPLVTDHYLPRAEGEFPTLLVRSPYGRGLPWSPMYGILFAEQGFHVVLQSCRGTGGSGGEFALWRHEVADGQATVAWLREQPWFDGRLGTVGPSYLGYVQWALAQQPPPELRAMVVQLGLHDPHALFHAPGTLRLENTLAAGASMTHQHRGVLPLLRATLRVQHRLRTLAATRPLRAAFPPALGGQVPWVKEVLDHPDAADPYWEGASLAAVAERSSVPTSLITGWHDALLEQTLAQYARLRQGGCETALLVGPWTHTAALQQGWPEVFAESLAWLRAHLCADPSALRPARVRVHLGGEKERRDLDDWPPPSAATSWYPSEGGRLVRQPAPNSVPLETFRYDPGDPTPSVGGPLLSPGAGSRDNATLERRADVLTFTGPELTEPLDVLGPVHASLTIATDGTAHVFTRLCDVGADGRSFNVCDGLGELRSADGERARITVPMSSTAHRFKPGHRLRWQLSAGAHPRYARNPGTGEPPLDAPRHLPVDLTLYADSMVVLPVYGGGVDCGEVAGG